VLRFSTGNLGDHKSVGGGVWEARVVEGPSGGQAPWQDEVKTGTPAWRRICATPAFVREFLLAAIDEGVKPQIALGKVIRAMGVKEFAAKVRMASPNVLRAIDARHNPTQATLDRLLKPFGLRLSLAPLRGRSRRTAA
jgi:DNA-binding phage protein